MRNVAARLHEDERGEFTQPARVLRDDPAPRDWERAPRRPGVSDRPLAVHLAHHLQLGRLFSDATGSLGLTRTF